MTKSGTTPIRPAAHTAVAPSGWASLRMIWDMLDRRERWQAVVVLVAQVLSAFASAVMVLSVMPFLQVLSNPGSIETVAMLNWLFVRSGFTSEYDFIVALGAGTAVLILLANLVLFASNFRSLRDLCGLRRIGLFRVAPDVVVTT